jgi:flagellar protein FlbD
MIKVTRLDESTLVINADLIELIESIPETIICLTTGKKIIVKETVDVIVERVARFKQMSGVRFEVPEVSTVPKGG